MDVETILDLKGHDTFTIAADAKIADAVATLKTRGVGALVVSDDGSHVDGILSERDIVRGLAELGPAVLDETVGRLMTKQVFTCAPEDSTVSVMAVMSGRRLRHVPVVKDGVLCGMISSGDVMKKRLDEIGAEAEEMRRYIATA